MLVFGKVGRGFICFSSMVFLRLIINYLVYWLEGERNGGDKVICMDKWI